MLTEAQIDKCRGEGFIPMPKVAKMEFESPGITRAWVVCPFCQKPHDHYASMVFTGELGAIPCHCFISRRMAWVNPHEILDAEERKFRQLLEKFKDLPDWIEPEEAFRLRDERGCPEELLEDRTNMAQVREIAESRKRRVVKPVYDLQ